MGEGEGGNENKEGGFRRKGEWKLMMVTMVVCFVSWGLGLGSFGGGNSSLPLRRAGEEGKGWEGNPPWSRMRMRNKSEREGWEGWWCLVLALHRGGRKGREGKKVGEDP